MKLTTSKLVPSLIFLSIFFILSATAQNTSINTVYGLLRKGQTEEARRIADSLAQNYIFARDTAGYTTAKYLVGVSYQLEKNPEKARLVFDTIYQKVSNSLPESSPAYINLLNGLGFAYRDCYLFDQAEAYLIQAKKIIQQNPDLSPLLTKIEGNLASLYDKEGNYRKALSLNKDILQRTLQQDSPDPYTIGLLRNNMGLVLTNMERYKEAEVLFRQNFYWNKKHYPENLQQQSTTLSNLLISHYYLQNYDTVLQLARKVIALSNEGNRHTANVIDVYNNLGRTFEALNKPDSALYYTQRGIELKRSAAGNTPDLGSSLLNYAGLLIDLGRLQDVSAVMAEVSAIYHDFYPDRHPEVARMKNIESKWMLATGNLSEAADRAMEALTANSIPGSESQQLGSRFYRPAFAVPSLNYLYESLATRAVNENKPELAKRALFRMGQSDTLLMSLLNGFESEVSNRSMLQMVREATSRKLFFIDHCKALLPEKDYLAANFRAMEAGKFVLVSAQANFDQANSPKIDSLLNLLTALKAEARALSQEDEKYYANRNLYYELVAQIETNFPDYHRLKFGKMQPLEEVQELIKGGNQAAIHYFYSDTAVYRLTILQDQVHMAKHHFPTGRLEGAIDTLNKRLAHKRETLEQQKMLYNILFANVEPQLTKKEIDRITIIPYGKLNYLPFEILVGSKKELIYDYAISYDYSLQKTQKTRPNRDLSAGLWALSFAENTNPYRNAYGSLLYAEKEINQIAQIFQGETYANQRATETHFAERANDFEILHLATHAIVDNDHPEQSSIILSPDTLDDGKLFTSEIASLDLGNTLLVSLSACNTGVGKLIYGEGLLSISRAFNYAGVASSLQSLWLVSDASSTQLMPLFYQKLREGKTKDEALRLAKLAYLSNAEEKGKHPFYWAAYTISGDLDPLAKKRRLYPILAGSLVFILMIVVVIALRNRRTTVADR